jgi:peroxiredoxin (alkyl hydroperoxide reductase subunit C)
MEYKNNCQGEAAEPVKSFPLIGEPAPAFQANTTQGMINFPADYKGKWIILFSHPADFTPVCTTEFMTFAKMKEEFDALNVQLVGLSVDSIHSHVAWLKRIEDLEWKDMKNLKVTFPLIDDVQMKVANKYGMLQGESPTAAVRAVFFIDPKGIVRTIIYYPASLGRNFDEIKRVIQGLQKADSAGGATPADWRPGDDLIVPAPSTMEGVDKRMSENKPDQTVLDWFLTFRKDPEI